MMAYRVLLADLAVKDPPLQLEYIELADKLGINPEVWKLGRAIERRFGKEAKHLATSIAGHGPPASGPKTSVFTLPPDLRRSVKASWKTCEYTLLMHILFRLRGDEA